MQLKLHVTCKYILCMVSTVYCTNLYTDQNAQTDQTDGNKNLLVFGGNGFIGSHIVETFLKHGYNITCINRNNTYWNWKSEEVTTIICDRDDNLHECKSIISLEDVQFFAVIDLSGYIDLAVMQALEMFLHRFRYFVYVSTDSVYDIVDKRSDHYSVEEDGVFPKDKEVRDQLKQGQLYAERKLTSEVIVDLFSQEHNGGFHYGIVRIPDTFGPRDSTFRFWYYMTAARLDSTKLPLQADSQQISLVYVKDVSNFIYKLIEEYRVNGQHKNVVYNLAYPETITVTKLINKLSKQLPTETQNIQYTDVVPTLYPSVTSGPIDVSKVANKLHFQLTNIDEAMKQSVQFYLKVEQTFTEWKEMEQFADKVVEWNLFSDKQTYYRFIN